MDDLIAVAAAVLLTAVLAGVGMYRAVTRIGDRIAARAERSST